MNALPSANELRELLVIATQRRDLARRAVYGAFEDYRLSSYGSPEGPCGHCLDEKQFEELRLTPLAQLDPHQIWSYCGAEWHGVADFKYFLPRLLDVAALACPASEWDELQRKLPDAGWSVCSEDELEAVSQYIAAADEHVRMARAVEESDPALLLPPLVILTEVAAGLSLEGAVSRAHFAQRSALFQSQLELWHDHTSFDALALLARGVNVLLDDRRTHERLKNGKLMVVPAADLFVGWVTSGAAEEVLVDAFEQQRVPDDAAVHIGAALANITSGKGAC